MKIYNLIIKEEARCEIIDTYQWYEDKQEYLGDRFIDVLDDCFFRIKTRPSNFPKKLNNMRQLTIKEFPYIIIFEVENDSIIVYAVFNTNRKPENWKKRNS